MTGQINVNKIAARTGNAITIESGDVLTQPGSVIQTVFTASDTKFYTTSASYVEYLSLAITPKLATSKIFVKTVTSFGGGANSYASGKCDRTISGGATTVLKNGTTHHTENRFANASFSLQCNNNNDAYKIWVNCFDFLDSPSTTTTCTYKLHILADASSRVSTVNRPSANPSDGYNTPANTTMTLMEIAQ
tara:strand:- start:1450 stop:2022 length:573 start_codon:yes stop_codon:yes gene_type:complete